MEVKLYYMLGIFSQIFTTRIYVYVVILLLYYTKDYLFVLLNDFIQQRNFYAILEFFVCPQT